MSDAPDEAFDVDVLFDEGDVLVIDKPAGLAMHGGVGVRDDESLHGAILEGFAVEPGFKGPSFLGRLDRPTSGIVVAALSRAALQAIEPGWRSGAVKKDYWVLVHGRTPETGVIDVQLAARRPGKKGTGAVEAALTTYVRAAGDKRVSLVLARIHTGRTHQIRRHMKAIGHPLVGDDRYGHAVRDADLAVEPAQGLMLHAARVSHHGDVPILPRAVVAPPPERMRALVERLSLAWPTLPDTVPGPPAHAPRA